jgi:N-methylhydantoinase A/oxoprolinase/acetone carboxylase beta subunit
VSFDGKFRAAPTYRRAELLAGNKISGPALIEEAVALGYNRPSLTQAISGADASSA